MAVEREERQGEEARFFLNHLQKKIASRRVEPARVEWSRKEKRKKKKRKKKNVKKKKTSKKLRTDKESYVTHSSTLVTLTSEKNRH